MKVEPVKQQQPRCTMPSLVFFVLVCAHFPIQRHRVRETAAAAAAAAAASTRSKDPESIVVTLQTFIISYRRKISIWGKGHYGVNPYLLMSHLISRLPSSGCDIGGGAATLRAQSAARELQDPAGVVASRGGGKRLHARSERDEQSRVLQNVNVQSGAAATHELIKINPVISFFHLTVGK